MRKLEQCENALRTMRNAFAQHLDAPAATEGTPHQGDPPCLRAATANSPESNALGRPFSVTMKTSDDEEDIGTRGKKRLRLHSSANGTTSPIAGHISESRAVVPSNAGESAEWERLIQDLLSYLQQPELPVPFIKAILQDIKSEIIHTATRYRLELLPRRFSGEKSGPMTNNENRPPSLVHLDNATSAPDADVPTRSGFDLGRRFVPVAAPAAEPANGGLPGRLTTLCRARDALEEKLDNLAEGVSNNPSTKALEGNSLDPAILSRLASAFMSLAGVTDLEVNDQDAYDAPVPTDFARLYIALKAVSARHANRKYTLVREKLQAAMEKEKWRAEIFRIDTEAGERRQKEQDLVNEKRKRVSAAMRAMPMMRRASLPSLKQQKEKQEKLDQEQRAQEAQVQEVEVRQIIVSERNDETGSDRGSVDIVRESLEVGGNTDEAVRGSIEVRATIKVSPRTEDNTRCGSRVLMASSDIPRGRTEVAGGALDNPRNSAEGARRSMDVIRTPEDGNLVGLIGFPMKCEKEPIAATKAELESSPGTKANRRNREGSGGSVSDLEDHYSEKKDKRMQIGKASRGATKGPSTRAASVIETGMKRRGSTGSLDLILCGGTQDEDESVVEWPGEDRTHVAGVLFKSSRGSHKSGASDGRKSESRGQVEKSKVVEKDNQQSQQVLGEVEREGKECANVQEHATQSQIGCKALKRAVIRGSPQKPHVRVSVFID
ncbi:hypothetical protein HK104_008749 [Borealophlyctis nickersoniae]|nr:hypothetical protein HK104_008749 [Borealophlyctis nickersoniae]